MDIEHLRKALHVLVNLEHLLPESSDQDMKPKTALPAPESLRFERIIDPDVRTLSEEVYKAFYSLYNRLMVVFSPLVDMAFQLAHAIDYYERYKTTKGPHRGYLELVHQYLNTRGSETQS